MNGVIMQRVLGLTIATFALSSLSGAPAAARAGGSITYTDLEQHEQRAPLDVTALLAAARGAPPMICGLASRAVRNYGWGDRSDAPASPLGSFTTSSGYDFDRGQLPAADVQRLMAGLSSDDACVREMSVRLIGNQKPDAVAGELISRLGSPDVALRTISALGLGLVEAPASVDPLIRALRDAASDVRANSAWALGRIENGRALSPLLGLFGDNAEAVR